MLLTQHGSPTWLPDMAPHGAKWPLGAEILAIAQARVAEGFAYGFLMGTETTGPK